jgi:uncharacterized OB-fold protein
MATLEVSGTPPNELDGLYLALGASPLAEGPVEQIVSSALGLKEPIATATFSGSELASLAALFSAGDAVGSGRLRNVLVIASEGGGSPRGLLPGAAAVALMVSKNGSAPIATIESFQRDGSVAYHRWRQNPAEASSANDNRFLKQYFNEHATRVFEALKKDIGEIHYAVFTGAPPKAVKVFLDNVLGETFATLPHSVDAGDYGVAGPFLALLTGLEAVAPGQRLAAVFHGSGQIGAMSLLAGKSKAGRISPPSKDAQTVSMGADILTPANPKLPLPAMSPFFWRNRDALLKLEAHRCTNCGFVAFPPSERPICRGCHSMKWEIYQLPRKGRVYTYCVNYYPPVGFPRQIIHILADLEDGTRYWGPGSGMDPGQVSIGFPVQLSLRRYTQDEGALVYGMKFVRHKS